MFLDPVEFYRFPGQESGRVNLMDLMFISLKLILQIIHYNKFIPKEDEYINKYSISRQEVCRPVWYPQVFTYFIIFCIILPNFTKLAHNFKFVEVFYHKN
jgi:hypothetical protein